MAEKSQVPWLPIVLTGLLAFVISIVITTAIVTSYAFTLGFQARGAPDQDKIAAFASRVIPVLAPVLLSLLVVFGSRRVVRRAQSPQLWHGLLVGVFAVLPTIVFMRSPGLGDVIGLLLPPASGLLGAYWAMSRSGRTVEET